MKQRAGHPPAPAPGPFGNPAVSDLGNELCFSRGLLTVLAKKIKPLECQPFSVSRKLCIDHLPRDNALGDAQFYAGIGPFYAFPKFSHELINFLSFLQRPRDFIVNSEVRAVKNIAWIDRQLEKMLDLWFHSGDVQATSNFSNTNIA